jgi:hypothetical protein
MTKGEIILLTIAIFLFCIALAIIWSIYSKKGGGKHGLKSPLRTTIVSFLLGACVGLILGYFIVFPSAETMDYYIVLGTAIIIAIFSFLIAVAGIRKNVYTIRDIFLDIFFACSFGFIVGFIVGHYTQDA